MSTYLSLCHVRDRTVINRHINNVFKEGECDKESNVHFLHIPNSDKPVMYYSLDVIISVGYRVKSLNGTKFRRWANNVLKQYLLKGYAVNQRIIDIEQKMIDQGLEITKELLKQKFEEYNKLYFNNELPMCTFSYAQGVVGP